MNDNKSTNNSEIVFTVSNTTSEMLNLLRDFLKLQERAIRLFGDWAEPQSVVGFTAFFREEEEGNDGKHSNKRSA